MKKLWILSNFLGFSLLLSPLLNAAIPDGIFSIAAGTSAQNLQDVVLVCQPPSGTLAPCVNPVGTTTIATSQSDTNFSVAFSAIQRTIFPGSSQCVIMNMACSVQAQIDFVPSIKLANFTLSRVGQWNDSHGGLAWSGNLSNVQSDLPKQLLVTSSQSLPVAGGYSNLQIQIAEEQAGRIALTTNVSTPPARLVCDKYNFTAQIDKSSGMEYFDFATLFTTAASPGQPPHIPVSLTNCSLQDSATIPLVYATMDVITNLAIHYKVNNNEIIWAANISNFAMGPNNFFVTKTSSFPARDDANTFNQYSLNISAITAGGLSLTGDITNFTDDIYLACDTATPVKATDWTVDLHALHGALPADSSRNFGRCLLESDPSKPNPLLFAIFSISNLNGGYAPDSSSPTMWAMSVSNIAVGNSAYSVELQPVVSNCDYQNPLMCNQIALNFHGPALGKIDVMNVASGGQLRCSNGIVYPSTPITGGVSFDLATLHGNDSDPSVNVDLANCGVFEGLTTYGLFNLQALSGAHAPPTIPNAKMWASEVTNVTLGLSFVSSDHCDAAGTSCNHWVLTSSAK